MLSLLLAVSALTMALGASSESYQRVDFVVLRPNRRSCSVAIPMQRSNVRGVPPGQEVQLVLPVSGLSREHAWAWIESEHGQPYLCALLPFTGPGGPTELERAILMSVVGIGPAPSDVYSVLQVHEEVDAWAETEEEAEAAVEENFDYVGNDRYVRKNAWSITLLSPTDPLVWAGILAVIASRFEDEPVSVPLLVEVYRRAWQDVTDPYLRTAYLRVLSVLTAEPDYASLLPQIPEAVQVALDAYIEDVPGHLRALKAR